MSNRVVSVIFVFWFLVSSIQCRKYSGGGSRPSYSQPSRPAPRPSPSYPSAPRPAPSYPSPSSPSRPSPSSNPSPSYSPGSPSYPAYHPPPAPPAYSPYVPQPAYNPQSGSGNSRPIGFDPPKTNPSAPIGPPQQNSPLGSAPNSGSGAANPGSYRPIGWTNPNQNSGGSGGTDSGASRPIGFVPPGQNTQGSSTGGQPIGPPKQTSSLGNAPPGYQGNPPAYNPQHNTAGYGQPPAYNPAGYGQPPAYNPAGYGSPPAYSPGAYGHPPAYSPAGYGQHPPAYNPGAQYPQAGGGGVTIINNNNHNYGGGGYGGGYGGGFAPSYHYTPYDTGSGTLGFFLGYSLAKLTTPSYHSYNSYNSYGTAPVYDHYEVHHYYHNKDNVPKEAEIQQNAIVGCVGDSGSFCPANTQSLCTNNGVVMCVASAVSTVPCTNEKQTNCVKSTVPCLNSTDPQCKDTTRNETTISLPCISTAKVYGSISYVNNSIVVSNATMQNQTEFQGNASSTAGSNSNVTTTTVPVISDTSSPIIGINGTVSNSTNEKKEPPQTFCVTILALPSERKLTEGEKIYSETTSIFGKFAVKALGLE